jgi:hypothetical protein
MNRLLVALVLASTTVFIGCGAGSDEGTLSSQQERSFGLMSITYTRDAAASDLELLTTAQFVRYSAVEATQVARLLALPLDPQRDLPAADSCQLYDLEVDLQDNVADDQELASIELLEAGNLDVRTSAGSLSLVPRHYPGLLPFIFGVVYGEGQADRVAQAGTVEVSGNGGEMVGAFAVKSATPELPQLTSLGGEMDPRQSLALGWQGTAQQGDTFYLELRKVDGKEQQVLRCRPNDDGTFNVSSSDLAGLGLTSGDRLQLDAARLRRTDFSASGLESAALQLTIRDRATLSVR